MTTTQPNRNHSHRRLPPLELGIVMQVGDVPLVLVRVTDQQVVRDAIRNAITAAQQRDGIGARQEARLLTGLLDQI
jgi:hypothetical protein